MDVREQRESAWYARVQWGLLLALAVGLVLEFEGTSTLLGSGATDQVGGAGTALALLGVCLGPLVMLGLWSPWLGGAAVVADAGVFALGLRELQGWQIAGRLMVPVAVMVALVAGTAVVRHGLRGLVRPAGPSAMRATLWAASALIAVYAVLLFAELPREPGQILLPLVALGLAWWRPLAGAAAGVAMACVAHFLRGASPVPESVATVVLYWPVLAVGLLQGLLWLVARREIQVTEVVTEHG